MYSSSRVRHSKPGPNFEFILMLSGVAGMSKRVDGGGFGGSDWPGAAAAPIPDGAAVVAGVPVSGEAVSAAAPGEGAVAAPPVAGAILAIWVERVLTIASSCRTRASS